MKIFFLSLCYSLFTISLNAQRNVKFIMAPRVEIGKELTEKSNTFAGQNQFDYEYFLDEKLTNYVESFSVGLQLGVEIKERFQIKTGLYFARKHLDFSDNFIRSFIRPDFSGYVSYTRLLEIPFLLNYKILKDRLISPFIESGIQWSQEYYRPFSKAMYYSLNVGIGMNIALRDFLEINVLTNFRHVNIADYNEGNFSLGLVFKI